MDAAVAGELKGPAAVGTASRSEMNSGKTGFRARVGKICGVGIAAWRCGVRTIAAEVNLLTERMALQRELQERLHKLDHELANLRGTILSHLSDVQHAADQQLTSARLRAEVSALAQTKLSAKLKT